jgi:circadian clock protein KaiC
MAASVLDNEDSDRRVWLETGIPGLDTILSGGLLQGGLYLVEGHAGTGKTILGFQCGLTYARRGDRVVVLTLLSESHGRLIDHLRGFDFFDGAVIARSFLLLSGYGAAKEGLTPLLHLLAQTLMQEKPRLLVIDGFSGLSAFAQGEQGYADFLLELSALVGAAGCTALLLSTRGGPTQQVQEALVDGIVELSTTPFAVRRIREVEVHKFRGADPIPGRHAFQISTSGIHVYPRFEAVSTRRTPTTRVSHTKLGFGLAPLDEMLGGGLIEGSTTSLLGAPGVGKTSLALKFLEEGLRRGDRALYLGFYEQPGRLLAKSAGIGMRLDSFVDSAELLIDWRAPLEVLLDEVVERLLELMEQHQPKRLVLDGIAGLRDATVNTERNQPFTAALLHELKARHVTTLITEELPLFLEGMSSKPSISAAFVENIVYLRYVEERTTVCRVLSLIKVRDGDHDPGIRSFSVSSKGFVVAERPLRNE